MSIKQADDTFSLIIKTRDNWTCQYCKRPINKYNSSAREFFDCSHFIKRSRFQTRYLEINSVAAHRECHVEYELNPKNHETFFINRIGEEAVNELRQRSNAPLTPYKSWYGGIDHVKELRERLNEVKNVL